MTMREKKIRINCSLYGHYELHSIILQKKAFMASNDDSNKYSKIIRVGLPAAIFATTGRPEIIEKKKV